MSDQYDPTKTAAGWNAQGERLQAEGARVALDRNTAATLNDSERFITSLRTALQTPEGVEVVRHLLSFTGYFQSTVNALMVPHMAGDRGFWREEVDKDGTLRLSARREVGVALFNAVLEALDGDRERVLSVLYGS